MFNRTSVMLLVFNQAYIYTVYENHSNILCTLEAMYICEELEDNKILLRNSSSRSLKRRIENLSKLIYIHEKVNKDKSKYYRAMSKDVFNKI